MENLHATPTTPAKPPTIRSKDNKHEQVHDLRLIQ